MSLFWREGTDVQLRRRISQLVYSLHRKTGEAGLVRLEGERYLIRMENVASDLEEFLVALRDGRPSVALRITQRGFLSGLTQVPTPDLERWIREWDLRFRSDVRTLAAERWAEAEQRANWTMAEEAAVTLLGLDPGDEAALRQLLRALALQGRAQEAEARFRRFCDLRRIEDPGWEAEEESLTLLGRLEEVAGRREEYVKLDSAPDVREPPMVGRTEELLRLAELIRHPPLEGVRSIVVAGEAGIGKTRLVKEALQQAPFDGVRVLSGKCSEFERNIPLSPILRCLSPDWVRPELEGLPEPWRSVVVSIFPEGRAGDDSHGPGEGDVSTPTHDIPRILCEAFHRLFSRLAAEEALVVFLDDFQWIDTTSLSVLEYICNSWEQSGLVLIVAVRPEDLGKGSREERWLDGARSFLEIDRLDLGPLPQDEASALVRQALASIPETDGAGLLSQDRIERIGETVGGHPLLALECIRSYAQQRTEPHSRVSGMHLPGALRQMILKRRNRLSSGARNLLDCLSLSEKAVPLSILEHVHGSSSPELSSFLDEAIREQFVTISPRGIEFRHGLFREAIYRALPQGRSALLHRSTGEALQSTEDRALAPDIALHFFAAGEPRRAIPFVLETAHTATSHGGWSEARSLLEMALGSEPTPTDGAALASELGKFLVLEGEFRRGTEIWTDAAEAFHSLGREEDSLVCKLRALEARSLSPDDDQEALLQEVRKLRTQAEDRQLSNVVGECMVLQIRLLDALRRIDEVRELTAEARALANREPEGSDLPFLLVSVIDALYGDSESAIQTAERAVVAASKEHSPDLILKALNWKIIAYYQQARLQSPDGQVAIKKARELARNSQDLQQRFHLEQNLGSWALDIGEYPRAERAFLNSRQLLDRISNPRLRRLFFLNRGHLALETADFQSAADDFRESLKGEQIASHASFRSIALSGLGLAYLAQGDIEKVKETRLMVPQHGDEWAFDPYDPLLWLNFQARVLTVLEHQPSQACSLLGRYEELLKDTLPTTWMRARLQRLALAKRHGIPIADHEREELGAFLLDRQMPLRMADLEKLIET